MKFNMKKTLLALSTAGLLGVHSVSMAAAFQLWEQDGATVGNYHAGRAAEADDASIGFYNPAGLVRIPNQQLVVGLVPILTDFRFRGTVNVQAPAIATGPQNTYAQGGGFNLVPDLHYAAPISDQWVFGFSVAAPFGLKTNYGRGTFAQFAATETSLKLIDLTPSLGFKINDRWSVGAGFDAEYAQAEFNLIGGVSQPGAVYLQTLSQNQGSSWGFGYHLGALYQVENTRIGLAYQSKVKQNMTGTSKFIGPLAELLSIPNSNNLKTKVTLPATTTLSVFHQLNTTWDLMATVIYTQWSVLKSLTLYNVSGVDVGNVPSSSITATVPENYRNTWNIALGANYHMNEQWMFRTGVGFDESPSNDTDRNLQLPDSDRIAVALGTHYQTTKTLGFDLGWTHIFAMNTHINNVHQVVGAQQTWTNGSIHSSADVFGLQMKWDIV
ncbi:MAG: outer membrane protein transport protein [Gammaproteobacteria bacterium]|nr:outer membrane protein transport protein [Gammaproteobacteria bacterium]